MSTKLPGLQMVVSVRLAGMASTRAISAACSGARSDAYRNSARIAVSRALRVAALLPVLFPGG